MKTHTNTYEQMVEEASHIIAAILKADGKLEAYPPTIFDENPIYKEISAVSFLIARLSLVSQKKITKEMLEKTVEKIAKDISGYVIKNKQNYLKSMCNG